MKEKSLSLFLALIFVFNFGIGQNYDCNSYVVLGVYQQNTSYERELLDQIRDEFRNKLRDLTKCKPSGLDFLNELNSLRRFNNINEGVYINESERGEFKKNGIEEVIVLRLRNTKDIDRPLQLWVYFIDVESTKIKNDFSISFTKTGIHSMNNRTTKFERSVQSIVLNSFENQEQYSSYFNDNFKVLVTAHKTRATCNDSGGFPLEKTLKLLEEYLGNNVIFIRDNQNSEPPSSNENAILRGQNYNADIVIWGDYYKECASQPKLKLYTALVNNPANKYLKRFSSNKELEDFTSISEYIENEIGRTVYWTTYEKSSKNKNWKKAEDNLKLLNEKVSYSENSEESAEINYKLGKSLLALNMSKKEFNNCKEYFNNSFERYENKRIERQKEWLNILFALHHNSKLKSEVEKEISAVGGYFLNQLGSEFPQSEEDYIFCISLAERIGKKSSSISDRLIKNKLPINSSACLIATIEYCKKTGKNHLIKQYSHVLINNFPHRPDGYEYLLDIFLQDESRDSIIKYANSVINLDYNNINAHQTLAQEHYYLGDFSKCRKHYLKAYSLDKSTRNINIEKYLDLFKEGESFVSAPTPTPPPYDKNTPPKNTVKGCSEKIEIPSNGKNITALKKQFENMDSRLGQRVKLKKAGNEKIIVDLNNEYFSDKIEPDWGLSTLTRTLYGGQGYYHLFGKDKKFDTNAIAKLNGLKSKNDVCLGQEILIIDGCPSVTYKTKDYATLKEASKELNVPINGLRKYNGEVNETCKKKVWIYPKPIPSKN